MNGVEHGFKVRLLLREVKFFGVDDQNRALGVLPKKSVVGFTQIFEVTGVDVSLKGSATLLDAL